MNEEQRVKVYISKLNISEEKSREIVSDYLNGLSIPQLSDKYKLSSWKIYNLLERKGITRNLSISKLSSTDGWRKLVGVGKGKSAKIVSIPYVNLEPLGFIRGEDLEGKWVIEKDRLVLLIRKAKKE